MILISNLYLNYLGHIQPNNLTELILGIHVEDLLFIKRHLPPPESSGDTSVALYFVYKLRIIASRCYVLLKHSSVPLHHLNFSLCLNTSPIQDSPTAMLQSATSPSSIETVNATSEPKPILHSPVPLASRSSSPSTNADSANGETSTTTSSWNGTP